MAEVFRINVEEVKLLEQESKDAQPVSPVRFDQYTEVEIETEDVTDEYYPRYQSTDTGDGFLGFDDLVTNASAEMLKRKISEKLDASTSKGTEPMQEAKVDEFKEYLKKLKAQVEKERSRPLPKYKDDFQVKGRRAVGQIIAWGWFGNIKCFGIKREK